MTDSSSSPRQLLRNLLIAKPLRNWSVDEVLIWLAQVNDGHFSHFIPKFVEHNINGKKLLTLDEKQASKMLGTNHQITTFTISIKSLKTHSIKKYSERKISENENENINTSNCSTLSPAPALPIQKSLSMTPKKDIYRVNRALSLTDILSSAFNLITKDDNINGDIVIDKKILWDTHKTHNIYDGFLFKKGEKGIGKKTFKKRWFVLCTITNIEQNSNNCNSYLQPKGYAFYFRQRPSCNSDYPLGFIDLQKLESNGVVGMFTDDEHENEEHATDDNLYEFVLKCVGREWILGAVDVNTYIQWMARFKQFLP